MDKLNKEQRRKNMQAVKSSGSKIERILAKLLWRNGFRYRKNDKTVFGKPDFIIKKYKIAIFCDGEFWHGKDWAVRKKDHKTNKIFWYTKIERNIERDQEVNKKLKKQGWTILRFWETEIEKYSEKCMAKIKTRIVKNNKKTKTVKSKISDKYCQKKTFDILKVFDFLKASGTHSLPKKIGTIHRKHDFDIHFIEETNETNYSFLDKLFDVPFKEPIKPKFTFIDLFAGIGGFRMAMQNLGGKCVFSSEWDEQAQKTYFANYGDIPFGDITKEGTKIAIPDNFDILCAGFPCQAFSLAGRRLGFEEARGTLFFDVADVIKRKKPKAFFLENVKGLKMHEKGKTLQVILKILREDLGYYVPDPEIINAMNFGVPQHRERIYIIGFRKDLNITDFKYPRAIDNTKRFVDIKENAVVSSKYYLSTQYQKTLIAHKQRHANKGNGFGYEIIPDNGIANAIVVGGMGRERNLVIDKRLKDFTPVTKIKGKVNRDGLRRMTPREWARLQGFPDSFQILVADASAYKQFGNSVAIPAIQATAKEIIKKIILKENDNVSKRQ